MTAEFDAFFSYRRKDLERARPLLAALASTGLRVWRDENDLPENAPITAQIRNAIARSKALIALYSADYPLSRACFEELSTAWIAAQQAGDLPYSRVLVLNPEPGFEHVPAVFREQQSMGWPRDGSGFAEIAAGIQAQLGEVQGTLHNADALARPEYHPAALIAAPRFVGRVRELWELHGQLTADRMSIITGVFGPAAAQVRGMGGNGKSMLAREYAIRFGAAFPGGIFWLNAFGNDDSKGPLDPASREALRRDQVRTFAVRCGVEVKGLEPEQVETALWEQLRERGQPCLWIVDDLPSALAAGDIENLWMARWTGVATLLTTRSTEYASMGYGIDLEMLADDEAFRLLTSRRPPGTDAETQAAREIVRELGCHPLAIEVAASYVARGFSSYSRYSAALSDPDSDALEFGAELKEGLPTGHERSITTTLLRSVRMLGADGIAFLELASVLAVAPIPVSFVEAVFNLCPEPPPNAIRGIDDADSLSLAKMEGDDARTVHTLIARAVRHSKPDRDSFRAAAFGALLRLVPDAAADVRRHGEIQRELVHARHLIAAGLENVEQITVAAWVAHAAFERGDYAYARNIQEQVVSGRQRLLGAEHPDTLTALANLAQTAYAEGDLAVARELQEHVLEARRRLLGPEHPHTLLAMNNLAGTMNGQGDVAGAREVFEEVLKTTTQLLGPDHPDTLSAMGNVAGTLLEQGEFVRARELYEQLVEASRRALGADHPATLRAMNNLAEAMRAQGDLAGARELLEQVLEARRRLLGAEHPDTITTVNSLAQLAKAQGDLGTARQLLEQVLEVRLRLLGPEHPDTLNTMNRLAQTIRAQGDLVAARKLLEQVLEISRRRLGAEHPDTLNTMNSLAQAVKAQRDLVGARDLQQQVLEATRRRLGADHPNTLTATNNLAQTMYDQGDLAGALELQREALEASRRVRGPEHPDTTIAAWNLLRTLLDTGNREDAVMVAQLYLHPLRSKDRGVLSAGQRKILDLLDNIERRRPAG